MSTQTTYARFYPMLTYLANLFKTYPLQTLSFKHGKYYK